MSSFGVVFSFLVTAVSEEMFSESFSCDSIGDGGSDVSAAAVVNDKGGENDCNDEEERRESGSMRRTGNGSSKEGINAAV